jgi:hypothetical protein
MTTPFLIDHWQYAVPLGWLAIAVACVLWLCKWLRLVNVRRVNRRATDYSEKRVATFPAWLNTWIARLAEVGCVVVLIDAALRTDMWVIANAVQYSAYSGIGVGVAFIAGAFWLLKVAFGRKWSVIDKVLEGNNAVGLALVALGLLAIAAKLGT